MPKTRAGRASYFRGKLKDKRYTVILTKHGQRAMSQRKRELEMIGREVLAVEKVASDADIVEYALLGRETAIKVMKQQG